MSGLTTLRIPKEGVDAFEKAVENVRKNLELSVELIETAKDGSRFYKVDTDGNALFYLGMSYSAYTIGEPSKSEPVP